MRRVHLWRGGRQGLDASKGLSDTLGMQLRDGIIEGRARRRSEMRIPRRSGCHNRSRVDSTSR